MIVWSPGRRPGTDAAARPDGNDTDLRYLEQALTALGPIVAACGAAARSSRPDVRALARAALAEQTVRGSAISAVLHDWGRLETADRRVTEVESLDGLEGDALDRAFVVRLVAGAQASILGARGEMVSGASRAARLFARHAIHAGYRQLAALDSLLPATPPEPASMLEGDSIDRWSDDGGPGPEHRPSSLPGRRA
ncbi:hypothetical protein ASC64_11100 [Nocardioides sp. Root122]|uniref:hypothetical protein n=1 Tax=Nocardioides TaxID=1839 RepID=UPI00070362A8|nr:MULTISPECIES: hypothetical protein [Nocardioides]KQV67758.1 hypothetical protein ASC64_11100 [Nocardioides sp. Root122]MCK9823635.1 hypothetical protein [Nocardioides cavernae]